MGRSASCGAACILLDLVNGYFVQTMIWCVAGKEVREMIFVTGDTHRKFYRFAVEDFPEQKDMTREDYVIICGDFGGVWNGNEHESKLVGWLEQRPFTTLFVDGNHENFDLLEAYPVEFWKGGKIQRIRPHVIHLMRGQVFDIDGHTFFTMGGARSHDIQDGILDQNDPDYRLKFLKLYYSGKRFRVNHISWWEQELPDQSEYEEARHNLERVRHKVDYIITHCAPSSIVDYLGKATYTHDYLTEFLEEVRKTTEFSHWWFGHFHENRTINKQFTVLYEQIVRIE